MKNDRVYKDDVLMMISPLGITIKELIEIFNTKKRIIVAIQRNLNKDNSSDWYISTKPRTP